MLHSCFSIAQNLLSFQNYTHSIVSLTKYGEGKKKKSVKSYLIKA